MSNRDNEVTHPRFPWPLPGTVQEQEDEVTPARDLAFYRTLRRALTGDCSMGRDDLLTLSNRDIRLIWSLAALCEATGGAPEA